jgi:hypothetical protein
MDIMRRKNESYYNYFNMGDILGNHLYNNLGIKNRGEKIMGSYMIWKLEFKDKKSKNWFEKNYMERLKWETYQ